MGISGRKKKVSFHICTHKYVLYIHTLRRGLVKIPIYNSPIISVHTTNKYAPILLLFERGYTYDCGGFWRRGGGKGGLEVCMYGLAGDVGGGRWKDPTYMRTR